MHDICFLLIFICVDKSSYSYSNTSTILLHTSLNHKDDNSNTYTNYVGVLPSWKTTTLIEKCVSNS